MSGISVIKGWYDTHYTETSTEIPPIGHSLGTPDITLEGPFNPSKDREFNEIRMELPYINAMNLSYLEIHYTFNNGGDQIFYVWVDNVKLISDSDDAPMVAVSYHIDPWRTFNKTMRFGSGRVLRRPSTPNDYYQNFPYRYYDLKGRLFMLDKWRGIGWWVIFCAQKKDNNKVSSITYYTFPLVLPEPNQEDYWVSNEDMSVKGVCPRYDAIMAARFDEVFGIDPKTITGAWMCPIKPMSRDYIGYGSKEDCFRSSYDDWQVYTHKHSDVTYGCFKINITPGSASVRTPFNTVGITVNMTATERNPIYVTGPAGETIGAIPFGKHVGPGSASLAISATSAYIRVAFGAMEEGLVFDYLLPTIDVNENSWSSYVYSGQRDYDMAIRSERSNSSAVSGGTSTAVMGGILGTTLAGVEIGALGGPIGAGAGALIGAGAGILSAAAGWAYDQGVGNPKIQSAEDKLHASQPDSIAIAGDSNYLFFNTNGQVSLSTMKMDADSVRAIDDNIAVSGVSYGQDVQDCTALINGGGPMRIDNLIVTGAIPVPAKKWIQKKFSDGVRIIAR